MPQPVTRLPQTTETRTFPNSTPPEQPTYLGIADNPTPLYSNSGIVGACYSAPTGTDWQRLEIDNDFA
jgi:hypothetical protein